MTDALTLDAATHTYSIGARVLPSVTQVGDWIDAYAGVPRHVLEAAADRGRAVHLACELDDLGELGSMPDAIAPYVEAWRRLREEAGAAMLAVEAMVADELHGYAGTLDWCGHLTRLRGVRPTEICIIDRKATASLLPSVGPQTAGYLGAWNRSHPEQKAKRRFAAHLRADGTYRLVEQTEASDFSVFLSGLTLFSWRLRHHYEDS